MNREQYIANKIKTLRKEAGMTQTQLAKNVNITCAGLSRIEKGRFPTLTNCIKIADALNISLSELVGINETPIKNLEQIFFRKWQDVEKLNKKDQKIMLILIDRLKV